jgi:hypothetical protein
MMFKKIAAWFGRHPVIKTIAVTAVSAGAGAAVQAVTGGVVDPKTVGRIAGAAALTGVYGLFVKRPQDPQDPPTVKNSGAVKCGLLPPVYNRDSYFPCPLPAGHLGSHVYKTR